MNLIFQVRNIFQLGNISLFERLQVQKLNNCLKVCLQFIQVRLQLQHIAFKVLDMFTFLFPRCVRCSSVAEYALNTTLLLFLLGLSSFAGRKGGLEIS